jgi:UDP-2-acetamido-2,6-beta-L-arabino-hexul-4-ose reductase
MKTVLVTGSQGFIGRNLMAALERQDEVKALSLDRDTPPEEALAALASADVIFHLAGVNRPDDESFFATVNAGFTEELLTSLEEIGRSSVIVFASSIQAELDNPYGRSKKAAEESLFAYSRRTGAPVHVFRLPNVFGTWSRPDYNSVVATFCHRLARGLDITVSDPAREIELVYIDDVVSAFLASAGPDAGESGYVEAGPIFRVQLKDLADAIRDFSNMRTSLMLPDFSQELTGRLYATYLSFLPRDDFAYQPELKKDERGVLAELMKSPCAGQMFVSRTRGGVVRGNHFHDTKVEKFCVLEGDALIRLRGIDEDTPFEYLVSGEEMRVVDIPPGYTHSIENLTENEMVVLFWSSQIFDPDLPDTYFKEV